MLNEGFGYSVVLMAKIWQVLPQEFDGRASGFPESREQLQL